MTSPSPDIESLIAAYPEGAVVRAEDFGPVERAYAEAMHEDCPDPPEGHPLDAHSPWSGSDLEGTEPWPAFMARLARHGLTLALASPEWPAIDCHYNGLHDHHVPGGFVGPWEGPHPAEGEPNA